MWNGTMWFARCKDNGQKMGAIDHDKLLTKVYYMADSSNSFVVSSCKSRNKQVYFFNIFIPNSILQIVTTQYYITVDISQ